jgi:hypothetical protein
MTLVRETAKFDQQLADAADPFGITKKIFPKIIQAAKAAAAEAVDLSLSGLQTELNWLDSGARWTPVLAMARIAQYRELKNKQFKSRPWLQHKQQVFELLPPAIGELEDLLSQLILAERGFDPRELASDFETAVLSDEHSLRDIRTSFERLMAKYSVSTEAITFLEIRFNLVLEALTRASEEVLDVLTKKCPQCAERPKAEAAVCRFCGYRFEQASELQEIKAAKLRADQTALVAFRQAAGTIIRQMGQVLDVSIAVSSDDLLGMVKEELVRKARALAASQTDSTGPATPSTP